ncbi:bacteriohemerythrin [Psychromonas ossibalaenae]|uniref:bacteriohemerythrin n=1 Tax=Psychromonas ossibalaenae TaxID=444922 RepID=UPI00037E4B5D|nr:bacteriohemerythrin [Psychromonas ossibalaenae]
MEQIIWSEDLSVGVKLFDEQHKVLIAMINKLINDPAATTMSETVSDILTEMTLYAQQHFKSEEDLMIEYGYPHFDEHRSQHIAFRKKVIELCTSAAGGADVVPQVLLEYLKEWMTQHILCEDMEYKQFFKEKGVW